MNLERKSLWVVIVILGVRVADFKEFSFLCSIGFCWTWNLTDILKASGFYNSLITGVLHLLGQLSKSRYSIILFMNPIHCVTGFLFCEKDQGQWLSSLKHSIPTWCIDNHKPQYCPLFRTMLTWNNVEKGQENTTTSIINLFKFFYGTYLPWDNWDKVRGCWQSLNTLKRD